MVKVKPALRAKSRETSGESTLMATGLIPTA
jgi:hypothetical protein